MPHGVGDRKVQPVVRHALVIETPAHREAEAVPHHQPGNVIERVGVALAQFVCPEDRCVVEQRALAARFGRLGEPLGKMGHLTGIPGVDLGELFLGSFVGIGLMRQIVLPLLDAQPLHVRLTDRVGVLQAGHPREVGGQRCHHQFDLHPADLRHLVVLLDDPLFEHRHGVRHLRVVARHLLFKPADERGVLLQDPPILRRQGRRHRGQVLMKLVEHAPHALAILHLAVELVEHLIGVVDRGHGLVGACVDHPCPGVGAVGHEHAELERAEAGGRLGLALQKGFDLLVDGKAA